MIKDSKIYPQNQVTSVLVSFRYESLFLISSSGLKKKIFFLFTFLNWEKQTWYWENRWLFSIGNGAKIRPLEKGRKSRAKVTFYRASNIQTVNNKSNLKDDGWRFVIE